MKASSINWPYALRAMRCHAVAPDADTYSAAACVYQGQQHQHALHLLRTLQHRAMVPDVIIYGAAIGGRNKCQQHLQALHLLRATRRCAITPVGIGRSVAIGGRGESPQHQQALHP